MRSRLLLAPVMRLTTSVVAEPLIAAVLPAVGTGSCQRDDAAAELAAGNVAGGSHEPPHLQVHRPYEAVEIPGRVYGGEVGPLTVFRREPDTVPAHFVDDFFDCLDGTSQPDF